MQFSGSALVTAEKSANRLLYVTPVLADSVHVSGYATVTLRLASSKPAANLSVWLVMLPFDSTTIGTASRAGLITRGWADPQNHVSLTHGGNYDSRTRGEPLVPGTFYDLTFDLQPEDHVDSIRQADRPHGLLERPRVHALAAAWHGADDRPGRFIDRAAGGWWRGGVDEGVWRGGRAVTW